MAEEPKEAIFNAGIAKLRRIDYLKQKLHYARENGDFNGMFNSLVSIRMEIHERMNDEERKKAQQLQNKCASLLYILQNKKYGSVTDGSVSNSFLELEKFLNECEYKYGMSLPNKGGVGDLIADMD